jgi:hypothetical protein
MWSIIKLIKKMPAEYCVNCGWQEGDSEKISRLKYCYAKPETQDYSRPKNTIYYGFCSTERDYGIITKYCKNYKGKTK